MTIYTETFIPTYLYIKQHNITKKLYFGKTIQNPIKYNGSGKHWKSHIKKHGKEQIETLWYCLFLDEESIIEFATNFSIQENIIESNTWTNLVYENGINSGMFGASHSEATKLKMSESSKNMIFTEEHKRKLSETKIGNKHFLGHTHSEETKIKMSESHIGFTGKSHSEETKIKIGISSTGRIHSEETKLKMSDWQKGVPKSEEHKNKLSEAAKRRPKVICSHCYLEGDISNMKRYHFDNCKINPDKINDSL